MVFTVGGTSTANENQGNDHEDDGRTELNQCRPELLFSVTERSENVDKDDKNPEDGDEDGDAGALRALPVLDGSSGNGQLKR